MKKQNVMEEDWDYLIILDACRYDRFEDVYSDYLDGDLERRNSEAGATPEWLSKTFTKEYQDIGYHSANPYVNSYDMTINEVTGSSRFEWNSVEHFGYISDLWDKAWNEEKGTPTPDRVVEEVLNEVHLDRNVIHFVQPHLPFICDDFNIDHTWSQIEKLKDEEKRNPPFWKRARNYFFYDIFRKLGLSRKTRWFLRKHFVPPVANYENIYRNHGLDRVPEFYEESLRIALKEVKRLVEQLDGRIIITADHGECLGEDDFYGHEDFNHNSILTTVPWLVVK